MSFSSELMWLNILLFIVGVFALLRGSDWFIDAVCAIAHRFQISELIIGLTVVSMGTSLPELATNVYASLTNNDAIAFGNVVGSNITNVMLVLGLGALLSGPIAVPRKLFQRDGLMMLGMTLLTLLSGIFLHGLSRWGGILFLVLLLGYMSLLSQEKNLPVEDEKPAEAKQDFGLLQAVLLMIIGLSMVFSGAKLVVDNAVWVSLRLGVSQTLVAVTVVAFGTSLPELAVTISGIIKKHAGIALGNIVGSNIFNMMMILGVSSVIHPLTADAPMRHFNLPYLLLSDVLLLVFMRTRWKISRWNGLVLFAGYIIFLIINFTHLS